MSHLVTITTEVRDQVALQAACRRLKLADPVQGTFKLFSAQATGLAVQLPGWRFPVVCQLETGQLQFDDYEGRWGERRHLDALLQTYAVELAKLAARRNGHTVTEQPLSDGSIKLTVQVNGGVA